MKVDNNFLIICGIGLATYFGIKSLFTAKDFHFKPGEGLTTDTDAPIVSQAIIRHNENLIIHFLDQYKLWHGLSWNSGEFKINSMTRSPEHDLSQNNPNSRHILGLAVDFYHRLGSLHDLSALVKSIDPWAVINNGTINSWEIRRIDNTEDCFHVGIPYDPKTLLGYIRRT